MKKKALRGFALLKKEDPEGLRAVSSAGGRASQEHGAGHRWTKKEATKHAARGGDARWHTERGTGK